MRKQDWAGIWTALATPFMDGQVDYESLQRLVELQVQSGALNGIVVGGTTGESPTLEIDELKKIVDLVRTRTRGRMKVLVGTGSNCTKKTIELTRTAKSWGADGALVVVPYYNKPSQAGLRSHFTAVADAADLPIMLYNVPSRTITHLALETIQQLAQHPRITAIKEASGNVEFGAQIASTTSLAVLSGDDATCLQLARVGGVGVVSVISHLLPQILKSGFDDLNSNQKSVQDRLEELNRLLYVEANPVPLKRALFELGWIRSDEVRMPLAPLDERFRSGLRAALDRVGLLTSKVCL